MLNSSPAEELPASDEQYVEPSPGPDRASLSLLQTVDGLFADLAEVREAGARSALVGLPLADLTRSASELYKQAVTAVGTLFEADRNYLRVAEKEAHDRLQEVTETIGSLDGRRRTVADSLPGLQKGQQIDAERVEAALRLVTAGRPQFAAENRANAVQRHRDDEIAQHEHRLRILTARKEMRGVDAPRFSRLDNVSQKELESIELALDEVRLANHELQKKGFTRPVARFLNWSSFASFLGIGLVLAQLFAQGFPGLAGDPSAVLQLQVLLNPEGTRSLVRMFLAYAQVLVVVWAFAVAVVLLTFFLLRRLEGSRRRAIQGVRREQSAQDLGDWLAFLGFSTGGVNERLPVADRALLLQLLAALPIAIVAGTLGFYWVVTARPLPSGDVPMDSFQLVYLGSLYAVLCASAGTLFWLNVVRPRTDGLNRTGLVGGRIM